MTTIELPRVKKSKDKIDLWYRWDHWRQAWIPCNSAFMALMWLTTGGQIKLGE
jgi:hypothetical protein